MLQGSGSSGFKVSGSMQSFFISSLAFRGWLEAFLGALNTRKAEAQQTPESPPPVKPWSLRGVLVGSRQGVLHRYAGAGCLDTLSPRKWVVKPR